MGEAVADAEGVFFNRFWSGHRDGGGVEFGLVSRLADYEQERPK
jgi:hypothetical protein